MNLISPGVSVELVNESYYDSSSPGSVPLIVVATAANKVAPSGVGIAPYTAASKKGKLFLATSQRELIQNFGNPVFYSSGGQSLHGYELNEYGLHAAYQFLGMSNRAYVLRADLDTTELVPSDTAPVGPPANGTYWMNTSTTAFGVFQSNGHAVPGHAWVPKAVRIAEETVSTSGVLFPVVGFGVNGDFAVVAKATTNYLFEKIAGAWQRVGTAAWKAAHPTLIRSGVGPFTINAAHTITLATTGAAVTITAGGTTLTALASAINTAATAGGSVITDIEAAVESNTLVIKNKAGGAITVANGTGTILSTIGIAAKTYAGVATYFTSDASYPANSVAGAVWVKGTVSNKGADWVVSVYDSVSRTWVRRAAAFKAFDSSMVDGQAGKDVEAEAAAPVEGTIYVGYDAATGVMELRRRGAEFFETLVYEAGTSAPTGDAVEGSLWFSNDFRADIMVSDGSKWEGYQTAYPGTDPKGVIIAGSAPTKQTDGTALVENDLWLDASDLENYPRLYRFDAVIGRWKLLDTSDQTSPFGILFGDARADNGSGVETPAAMLVSGHCDPDAPDARTVPAGMLLFNTRYSTFNVKQWRADYFGFGGFSANTNYGSVSYNVGSANFPALADTGRWVTVSGNRGNGTPLMGRRAQRAMVTRAMAEALNACQEARSEAINFNLVAAPGYPEMIDEMITLNTDQRNTSFILGDTPIRLEATSQAITEWATNASASDFTSEDGLASDSGNTAASDFVSLHYPWGLSTNIDGQEIMVPPSTLALRTFAYNDQVAYPWFAPAGYQRGIVSNASAVGYMTSEGEFREALLSQGVLDTLSINKINPIVFLPGRGLALMGQKTLAASASAMDRINVARLVNYLNVALEAAAKPFLFAQNDEQTRDAFKSQLERLLNGLSGLRGIDDYAIQCDTENNTPDRVARNELHADIAVLPTKSVEYIHIPLRLNLSIND